MLEEYGAVVRTGKAVDREAGQDPEDGLGGLKADKLKGLIQTADGNKHGAATNTVQQQRLRGA